MRGHPSKPNIASLLNPQRLGPDAILTLTLASKSANIPVPNLSFPGNSTYAGATAAIVANIVLIGYVVVAFNDDKSEREADIASGAIAPLSEGRKEK